MDKYKIRSWLKDDFSTLAKYLNNKKIWDNCRDSLPYPYSESDAQQFIRFVLNQSEQNNYCIEVNQEAVGNISFSRGIDVERYNAELGYWLAEPYWGKGIMTQMLVLAIRSYFSHTDVIRVYANVYAGNMSSMSNKADQFTWDSYADLQTVLNEAKRVCETGTSQILFDCQRLEIRHAVAALLSADKVDKTKLRELLKVVEERKAAQEAWIALEVKV